MLIEILEGDIPADDESFNPPDIKFGRLARYVANNPTILPQQTPFETRSVNNKGVSYRESVSLWRSSTNGVPVLLYTADIDASTPLNEVVEIINFIFEREELAFAAYGKEGLSDAVRTKYCLVFLPQSLEVPDFDFQQRIIYRANLDASPEFINLIYPPELNRRENTGAALGPLVALLWGHQDYVENIALLSAIMAVGAESGLRRTHVRALALLKDVDSFLPKYRSLSADRHRLLRYLSEIVELENLLILSADAGVNLFTVIPSLRPADFHRALYGVLEIQSDRDRAARILSRVNSMVSARADQIRAMEESEKSSRNRRWVISVSAASTIAIPFSIIFGYFSLEGSQPDPDHFFINVLFYWKFYLTLLLGTIIIFALHGLFYHLDRRRLNSEYGGDPRSNLE
ncbi:hypothetical protein [Corynebacterium phocae]|uniref:hypothetical protein n=1 Tax=Corynebacterium phocae TaxID=161895 RepID=UPI0012ED5F2C|nr:hypothetical protein [Corynebacterium phocae]